MPTNLEHVATVVRDIQAGRAKGTLTVARLLATGVGFTITRKRSTGEYRVNHKGGSEASAYYTDNLDDALSTMLAMQKQRETQPRITVNTDDASVFIHDHSFRFTENVRIETGDEARAVIAALVAHFGLNDTTTTPTGA